MQSHAPVQSPQAALKGAPRVLAALAFLAAALAVSVPVYGGWLSGDLARAFRFGMPVLWGVLALATAKNERGKAFTPILLGLFGVSLGFALAYVVGSRPIDLLGLSWRTPKGAAVDKIFSEVITVSAALFMATVLSRRSLASLGLRGGRVGLSLALG
ncbi:MAG: hypothetical protein V2A76_05320, partial [Planctomycetota bacterium]